MPKYTNQNVIAGVKNVVAGVPIPTQGQDYSDQDLPRINDAFSQLEAFRIWLKIQNSSNSAYKAYDLPKSFDKAQQLKAALRVIALVKLDYNPAGQEPAISDFYHMQDSHGRALYQNIDTRFTDTKKGGDSAEAGDTTLDQIRNLFWGQNLQRYADDLLNDINAYVRKNDLKSIVKDENELRIIEQQLAILNPQQQQEVQKPVRQQNIDLMSLDSKTIRENGMPGGLSAAQQNSLNGKFTPRLNPLNRLFNFTVFGFIFSAFFPWSYIYPMVSAAGHSIYNAFLAEKEDQSTRPYGKRVSEMVEGYPAWLGNILKAIAVPIDMVLGGAFETLRLVFSYDDWSPVNQYRFNQVENVIFNILYSPITLLVGAAEGLAAAYRNLFPETQVVDDEDEEQTAQPNLDLLNSEAVADHLEKIDTKPYGLAAARGINWVGRGFTWLLQGLASRAQVNQTQGPPRFFQRALQVIFWPITLLYALDQRVFDSALTDGLIKQIVKYLILPLLTLAFLPIDLVVGGLAKLGRAFGFSIEEQNEKKMYTFFASLWAGFWFSTVIAPTVLIPVFAAFAAPLAWAANLVLYVISSFHIPLVSPADIFQAINTVTGKGLFNALWGEAGIFAKGLVGFKEGMVAFGQAFSNPQALQNVGNFLGNYGSTNLFTQFTTYVSGLAISMGAALFGYRAYQDQTKETDAQGAPTETKDWGAGLWNSAKSFFGFTEAPAPVTAVASADVAEVEEQKPADNTEAQYAAFNKLDQQLKPAASSSATSSTVTLARNASTASSASNQTIGSTKSELQTKLPDTKGRFS